MTRQPDPPRPLSLPGPSRTSLRPPATLDRTRFPAWRDRIAASDGDLAMADDALRPRAYPGYPSWPLPRPRRRLRPSLERALQQRRSVRRLETALPSESVLGRILYFAHGGHCDAGRGPVPSAGGLQALELYIVNFAGSWLPAGIFHYNRESHALAQLAPSKEIADRHRLWDRARCQRDHIPALATVSGGALLWIAVGDGERVRARYDTRADHFLALEAGHLMQNLCLLSTANDLCTVPLGGYYEHAIARALSLPAGDLVLYAGVCGVPGQ